MRLRADHLSELSDLGSHRTLFLGKAGEHYVASRLLRLGYNAAAAPVDTGVDILAHRMSKYGDSLVYQIQVKTTTMRDWTEEFTADRFARLYKQNINVVMLFWSKPTEPTAVVLPPSLLHFLAQGDAGVKSVPIYRTGTPEKRKMRIFLRKEDDRVCIRNKRIDISPMIDRFALIEDTSVDATYMPPYVGHSGDETSITFFDDDAA